MPGAPGENGREVVVEAVPPGRTRLPALDGLRGYAAVAVLVYHAMLLMQPTLLLDPLARTVQSLDDPYGLWAKLCLATFDGETAVDLFFLLSGCVLIRSIERSLTAAGFLRGALMIAVRRLLRIMPALIVCILGTAAAFEALSLLIDVAAYEPGQIMRNLLLEPVVIGPSWTLRIEILMTPFLIVAGALALRFGTGGLLFFLIYAFFAFHTRPMAGGDTILGSTMIYFALGCLVPGPIGQRATRVKVGALVPLLAFLYLRHFFPMRAFAPMLLQAAAGFWLLSVLHHGAAGRISVFLEKPVSQFFGRMSYSFYLWNVPFLNLVGALRPRLPAWCGAYPVEAGFLVAFCTILPALGLAWLSERFVERPGIELGHRLARSLGGLFVGASRRELRDARAGAPGDPVGEAKPL